MGPPSGRNDIDSDGDGLSDAVDDDDDNDGILDDHDDDDDGDGILDNDEDDDGDGIENDGSLSFSQIAQRHTRLYNALNLCQRTMTTMATAFPTVRKTTMATASRT